MRGRRRTGHPAFSFLRKKGGGAAATAGGGEAAAAVGEWGEEGERERMRRDLTVIQAKAAKAERERCLLTINDLPEVGKRNALSGNTAAGHSQPSGSEHDCYKYTPTLRLTSWHAWRTHGGRHRISIPITSLFLRDSAPRGTYLRLRRFRDPREAGGTSYVKKESSEGGRV